MTAAELSALMTWKLSKGKFRPRLQAFVDALSDEEVRPASETAFAALEAEPLTERALRDALAALTAFKGVGPATASAALAAACPAVPFMGDEALAAALPKREYTVKAFLALGEELRSWAGELAEEEAGAAAAPTGELTAATCGAELVQCAWSAQLLQLALYARGAAAKALGATSPDQVEAASAAKAAVPTPTGGKKRRRSGGAGRGGAGKRAAK